MTSGELVYGILGCSRCTWTAPAKLRWLKEAIAALEEHAATHESSLNEMGLTVVEREAP